MYYNKKFGVGHYMIGQILLFPLPLQLDFSQFFLKNIGQIPMMLFKVPTN